ncbi:transcription elongation factor GreA [Candidatus Uhrbacteria bacterium CG_4_10_14_0_8_um_filter_58_22]|uniref:Transcription elongation factor GreA n=1 Tax=Candidatus Uhrbacteria bacterium CG_4_10_14_0_8_um_filter_58_22 TaxID=1975029 RepID=A0A2M7Q9S1_9BACT|nr:MAG: hypothetical protein AUJ19_00135 [Parcubacteria group bacterium CG1_02_58_44]PIY62586.1 MAG: transcription elongation factor GreA [Candidatus Uhrbacteria bacterium CG_4_10_14_0_8_um_filter_58_22]
MQNKTVYVSEDGLLRLKKELEFLDGTKRKELAERIGRAKEMGDLKENSEYHDARDEMSMLMGRIRRIEDQISRSRVVEKGDGMTVGIGSSVKLKGDDKEKSVMVVGATEAEPNRGIISNESPLGQELIGKKVGDSVTVTVPAGKLTYTVIEIS